MTWGKAPSIPEMPFRMSMSTCSRPRVHPNEHFPGPGSGVGTVSYASASAPPLRWRTIALIDSPEWPTIPMQGFDESIVIKSRKQTKPAHGAEVQSSGADT